MKVAVAHPEAAVRQRLNVILQDSFGIQCAWEADDSQGLRLRFQKETPDILLLSLDLEGEDVSDLTRDLIRNGPCAILLLEGSSASDVSTVFDCLGQGATDVARLPVHPLTARLEDWANFRARFATLKTLQGRDRSVGVTALSSETPWSVHMNSPPIVALGASTGGPKALATILGAFPEAFPAAVVIVQHLDAHFYQGLSEWLAHGSRLPVVAVDAPVTLEAGIVYLAARPEHMVMSPGDRLSFTREWPELVSRPSIDVLFRSLAEMRGAKGVAALMTGMGRDGAEGLLALRRAGFYTIAQDAPSSVVYGMPRVAAEIDAATTVLPLDRIGARIVEKVQALMDLERDTGTHT
ncbi:MAG: hypothetical protein RLZ25_2279 [Pseudomonadota bacterium]